MSEDDIFTEAYTVRFRKVESERMADYVEKNPDLYSNVPHLIRCAVIRQLKLGGK